MTGRGFADFSAGGADEQRVCGERTGDVDAALARRGHCWPQHTLVFAAEQTVLAGVRIQTRQRQPRNRHPESRQLACGQVDHPVEHIAGQRA